jgi:hypothetical protein
VTKSGNRKMFIDTKFAHPFEGTWMSFMFQNTIEILEKALEDKDGEYYYSSSW